MSSNYYSWQKSLVRRSKIELLKNIEEIDEKQVKKLLKYYNFNIQNINIVFENEYIIYTNFAGKIAEFNNIFYTFLIYSDLTLTQKKFLCRKKFAFIWYLYYNLPKNWPVFQYFYDDFVKFILEI